MADFFSVFSFQGFCMHCFLFPVWLNVFLLLQTHLECMCVYLFCSSCIYAVCNCRTSLQISQWFACVPSGWQAAGRPDVITVYTLLCWQAHSRLRPRVQLFMLDDITSALIIISHHYLLTCTVYEELTSKLDVAYCLHQISVGEVGWI